MPITDKLRKAVGLFVVMDEPTEETPPRLNFSEPAATPTQAPSAEMSELDRKLAEIEKRSQAIAAGATGATPPPLPQTVEQLVRQSAGPNLDEIKVSAEQTSGALLPDGKVDVQAIYAGAKLPAVTFGAEQTRELLSKLPPGLSLDMQRQMVAATLTTMGATMGASAETIVADASRKLAALAAYVTDLQKVTSERVSYAQAEIEALEARIAEQKSIIASTQQQLTTAQTQCEAEADKIDDILEFFSLDTGPSKYAAGMQPTQTPRV
ncbi:hypothetical protein [Armatimonas rosea]|uniref:Putative coiled-coil protein SlyX n=1 Tax=Armatimonas rosea TaxID=685828 RepID=A0A7W9SPP5_ARMRO|nr:hypothetical protein [Armatimonas rosea]MBB6050531.1 putative coiled-coil protein SlyX [Armatimonas rosea]